MVFNSINQRLTSNDEQLIVSGLRALKSVIQAFESAIEEERKPLDNLINSFFPVLEGLLGQNQFKSS